MKVVTSITGIIDIIFIHDLCTLTTIKVRKLHFLNSLVGQFSAYAAQAAHPSFFVVFTIKGEMVLLFFDGQLKVGLVPGFMALVYPFERFQHDDLCWFHFILYIIFLLKQLNAWIRAILSRTIV